MLVMYKLNRLLPTNKTSRTQRTYSTDRKTNEWNDQQIENVSLFVGLWDIIEFSLVYGNTS